MSPEHHEINSNLAKKPETKSNLNTFAIFAGHECINFFMKARHHKGYDFVLTRR